MENPFFSIIIPNWNGEAFLARGVSSLLASARAAKKPFEFIVVDDASTDNSIQMIKENFPDVKIIKNKKNRGFGFTVNRGVKAAGGEIVILANNDLVVKEDFIPRLLEPFSGDEAKTLFGVSAKTVNWTDGEPNHVNMNAHLKQGFIDLTFEDSPELCPTLFLQGGACAIRRELFLQLGLFSPIYHPGYWEDYDLSYRAAKSGYRLLYQPKALAYHLGKGSLSRVLGEEGINSLVSRNRFLFTWLNLSDRGFLFKHFLLLPFHLFKEMISGGHLTLTKGFVKAAPKFFRAISERKNRGVPAKISDRNLLK